MTNIDLNPNTPTEPDIKGMARGVLRQIWQRFNKDYFNAAIELSGNGVTYEIRSADDYRSKLDETHNKHKKPMALAQEILDNDGMLSDETMDAIIHELHAIRGYIDVHRKKGRHVDVYPIGTSPLRDARNSDVLRERILREVYYNFHVAKEDTEAEFAASAVLEFYPDASGLVVDMGGGSTEFALIKDGEILKTQSLPIGTSSIHREDDVLEAFSALDPAFFEAEALFPIGGTLRNVNKWIAGNEGIETLKTDTLHHVSPHNYSDHIAEILEMEDGIMDKNLQKRRDFIPAGAELFLALQKNMKDLERVHLVKVKPRDGFFATIARNARDRSMRYIADFSWLLGSSSELRR